MIPELRKKYNSAFKEETYNNFINDIQSSTGNLLDFKICETPLFLDRKLTTVLSDAAYSIMYEVKSDEFKMFNENAVPRELVVPNEADHPIFLQVDFGITRDENGDLLPQVIELQGFPSLYAYQAFLDQKIRTHFEIPEDYNAYFSGLNFESYKAELRGILLGDSQPENVILLEIEPWQQKTRIDFFLTKEYFGIEPVCITDITKEGRELFYTKEKKKIKIERIYNRVIFDELMNKKTDYGFDIRDDLDVRWVGHPNWFFKISKHSLPFFKNKYAPECYFLNELEKLPEDLEDFVLKPLFSFAGSGVIVDVTKDIIDSIDKPENFILQKKVKYEPIIETPDGFSKAEIRMMFLWDKEPKLVNNLLRTSKGKMMGVDFNKNKTWIGSSIAYHE